MFKKTKSTGKRAAKYDPRKDAKPFRKMSRTERRQVIEQAHQSLTKETNR